MILHGENLIITDGNGTPLAASVNCTIIVNAETISVSSDTDGEWMHHIVGRKSWQITTNHLFIPSNASESPLRDSVTKVGQSFNIRFVVTELDSDTMGGSATCTRFSVSGNKNSLLSGNFEWKGNGPLESIQ